MARTPDPKLHALWRERVRRQEASGLTIAQFCAQECVARSKFHAWKRRFRLMDPTAQFPALPTASAFVPVNVRLVEHAPDAPLPIEADLPNRNESDSIGPHALRHRPALRAATYAVLASR
jgi:hypothetical protein